MYYNYDDTHNTEVCVVFIVRLNKLSKKTDTFVFFCGFQLSLYHLKFTVEKVVVIIISIITITLFVSTKSSPVVVVQSLSSVLTTDNHIWSSETEV